MKTNNENREHCKSIAMKLEAINEGRLYVCPECGELVEIDDIEENETMQLSCGCTVNTDDLEEETIWDYFEDCYDVEITKGLHEDDIRSCRLMVAFGGPNIYIDTRKKAVTLYWWGEYAEYPLSYDVCEQINDMVNEWENC